MNIDPIKLTRRLVDIESISGNEAAVADVLAAELKTLGYQIEMMPLPSTSESRSDRRNVFATPPDQPNPPLVFSTHLDVVPPWFASREDEDNIYGRGSCDAKGIIAAQVAAAERLRAAGIPVGLLYVAGEERDSLGAQTANQQARGSKFLINGEPTESRLALASKGALRVELVSRGRNAHSAYPELGESAIDKLLDALQSLRSMELPNNPDIGPSTLNIGIIEGGRATNVIPDFAKAQLLYRLVESSAPLRQKITESVAGRSEISFVLDIPYMRFRTVPGIPTMTASFTTDIPKLTNWGEPLLFGPGSILVAHTDREFISKRELHEAVDHYEHIARHLLQV